MSNTPSLHDRGHTGIIWEIQARYDDILWSIEWWRRERDSNPPILVSPRFILAVLGRVAVVAEDDEIVFVVSTGVTAKLLVVDFEVGHGSAELTPPSVPPQHSFP